MITEKEYVTTIPRLSDINRQKRNNGRRERQSLYRLTGTHSASVERFYTSPAWRNARSAYIHEHPICELSLLDGFVADAEQVHHLVKWAEQPTEEMKWQLLLDPDNMIALTNTVHQAIHYNPDMLTDEQRKLLLLRKEAVYKKYLDDNVPIVPTDDKNF